MENYRNGEYGGDLHLNEILDKAGVPNLIDEMDIADLEYLYDHARGAYAKMGWATELKLRKGQIAGSFGSVPYDDEYAAAQ
jgi:hypothetical protein